MERRRALHSLFSKEESRRPSALISSCQPPQKQDKLEVHYGQQRDAKVDTSTQNKERETFNHALTKHHTQRNSSTILKKRKKKE